MELYIGNDQKPRCGWCRATEAFIPYHDQEWGFPVDNDQRLFEKLCLESFQSGLSWRTILAKRAHFRRAFEDFNIDKVAAFDQSNIETLLQNAGIVRHRGKIEAVINNAQCAQQLIMQEGSLAAFFWRYEPDPATVAEPQTVTTNAEAIQLSKDLKKKGWKFVGPTTIYSFMQAMGLVNDHSEGCFMREEIDKAKAAFKRPK